MNRIFNLDTVTILKQISQNSYLVKGKLIGGKRWKRGHMVLTKDEFRHIQLKKLV